MRSIIFTLVFIPAYLLTISVNAGTPAQLTSQAIDTPLCASVDNPNC